MSFPALLDTCVLFPSHLCDLFLTLAEDGVYRPLWSDDILVELHRNLVEYGLPEPAVAKRIGQMRRFFPDAEVSGYRPMVDRMTNDPKDRHVLAAAVCARAEAVVTFNIKDFKDSDLRPFKVVAAHPDEFLLDQLDLYPGTTIAALERLVARHRKEPRTTAALLGVLDRTGVPRFAAETRRYLR